MGRININLYRKWICGMCGVLVRVLLRIWQKLKLNKYVKFYKGRILHHK